MTFRFSMIGISISNDLSRSSWVLDHKVFIFPLLNHLIIDARPSVSSKLNFCRKDVDFNILKSFNV